MERIACRDTLCHVFGNSRLMGKEKRRRCEPLPRGSARLSSRAARLTPSPCNPRAGCNFAEVMRISPGFSVEETKKSIHRIGRSRETSSSLLTCAKLAWNDR